MGKKIRHNRTYLLIFIVLVLGITIGLGVNYKLKTNEVITKNVNVIKFDSTNINNNPNSSFAAIKIPAVDNNGNGVVTVLTVEAVPGTGKTLVDIDSLLFFADTQSSIRTAKEVAENITDLDLSKYDLVYNIKANASLIGGPSAGGALTVATIAALEHKNLKEDVMMTGSINHDGTIGPVGGITEKANAAKDVGAKIFLVPLLQSEEVVYEQKEYCKKFGGSEFCSIEQIPKRVKVEEETGIIIKEVSSVKESLDYFFV